MKPHELVKLLNGYNIRDIIILELGKVGTSAGIDTDFLHSIVELSTHSVLLGGGIRDMADINALKEIGVNGALVATAVHNGRIPVELIR
jgi:phosphoribosylformimino-5-aminoimidazole carboxamide ribotide isomerase